MSPILNSKFFAALSTSAALVLLSPHSTWAASSAYSAPTPCASIPSGTSLSSELTITAKSADLHSVKIKNNTQSNCIYQVGMASYQIFQAYNTKNWINTQQLFDQQAVSLNPGDEKQLSINLPSCAYQVDVFQGYLLTIFDDNANQTYGRQGRLLTSLVNYTNRPICGTTTPTATPYPTAVTQSTGQVLAATPTPTPPAKLPSTGPGDSIAVTLGSIVAALVGRKFIMAR